MQFGHYIAMAIVMIVLVVGVAYLGMLFVRTSSDLDVKTEALAQHESANAALEQTSQTLLADRTKLEVYLEVATDRFGELSSENVVLQSDLVAEKDRYARLEEDLASLTLRQSELESALDALTERHDTLASDYEDLAAENAALVQRNAEIGRLAERLPELQKRIAALEALLASNGGQ